MSTSGGASAALSLAGLFGELGLGGAYAGSTLNTLSYNEYFANVEGLGPNANVEFTSPPLLVAALGVVVDTPVVAASNVDTTTDLYSIQAQLYVTNTIGTQVLEVVASATIPKSGPAQTGEIDWSTATATALVGVDVTWDATTGVSTTAGGLFVATLQMLFES